MLTNTPRTLFIIHVTVVILLWEYGNETAFLNWNLITNLQTINRDKCVCVHESRKMNIVKQTKNAQFSVWTYCLYLWSIKSDLIARHSSSSTLFLPTTWFWFKFINNIAEKQTMQPSFFLLFHFHSCTQPSKNIYCILMHRTQLCFVKDQ